MSALNEANGFPKDVQQFIEIYPHDDKERKIGFAGCDKGTPLNTDAILFDIDAPDMKQVNLDSIAQEVIFIGQDAIAGQDKMIRFATLFNIYHKMGKYKDTAFGELLSKGAVKIPEAKPFRNDKEDDKDVKKIEEDFKDSSALDAVASAAPVVETEKASASVAKAEEEYSMD